MTARLIRGRWIEDGERGKPLEIRTMSSLRTEVIEALKLNDWQVKTRVGKKSNGVLMRHDLLVRSDPDTDYANLELMLVVVSEHPSQKVALNTQTWYEAKAACRDGSGVKALRRKLSVLICQEPYQLLVGSHDLDVILKTKYQVDQGKPRAYWPLSVGIL